ncbi:hypothetical protein EVAR_4766_1 [Eumeta japonica]|uniref:Uncharacterized protein n=1 Tax=Eumeta variegata TaxID=151549 RepID=A0A4C1T292_EUMVA|nr:hypothetical protein EVAR_4766_1 [Eumeta japonica]
MSGWMSCLANVSCTSTTPSNPYAVNGLQKIFTEMNDSVKKRGVKVNISMTKMMMFKRGESTTECDIIMEGERVEQVKKFVYLGTGYDFPWADLKEVKPVTSPWEPFEVSSGAGAELGSYKQLQLPRSLAARGRVSWEFDPRGRSELFVSVLTCGSETGSRIVYA